MSAHRVTDDRLRFYIMDFEESRAFVLVRDAASRQPCKVIVTL